MKWIVLAVLLSTFAYAQCVDLTDGMTIKESITLCSSTYDIPNGITIASDDIVLDCNTAILRGVVGESEIGIRVENADGVTIRNCNILTFNQGLYLKNVTNSLIEDNGILKNRIGIRLLDSFENTIQNNNDKSFQLAVSAINSKYNIVMLGNKKIERAFCGENACNEYRDMNVCEDGDFYCSKKCSPKTDNDCGKLPDKPEPPKEPEKTVEEIVEEAVQEVEQKRKMSEQPQSMTLIPRPALSLGTKILVYAILYIIAFIVIQIIKRRR